MAMLRVFRLLTVAERVVNFVERESMVVDGIDVEAKDEDLAGGRCWSLKADSSSPI